jgi:hypothetical protein
VNMRPSPLAFIVYLLAGWISRQQLIVVEYVEAGTGCSGTASVHGQGTSLAGAQGFRHSMQGSAGAGHDTFTPDTLLRWHRQLIARMFDFSHRRRPRLSKFHLPIRSSEPTSEDSGVCGGYRAYRPVVAESIGL